MTDNRWLATALFACAWAFAGDGMAQSNTGDCPSLPKESGLAWQRVERPGLTFCKALRDGDGAEVFAVVVSPRSPFKPSRSDRMESGVIDGREIRWYRGQIATDPTLQVRETLLELDDGRTAHVSLRAADEAELAARLKLAESIRFPGPRLSSN